MQAKTPKSITSRVYKWLAFSTFILIALQIWAGILYLVQPIPMTNLMVSFTKQILHSWVIIGGFVYYLFAQLLIHVLFSFILGSIALLVGQLFQLRDRNIFILGILIWLFGYITVYLANQLFYHWSIFSVATNNLMLVVKISFWFLFSTLLVLSFLAFIRLSQIILKQYLKTTLIVLGLGFIASLALFIKKHYASQPLISNKPNIIIIGIDSLRPDFTSISPRTRSYTPNIDAYLKQATVFPVSYTLLARTFPSWMSILTGEYPKTNEIRDELPDLNTINTEKSLAKKLKANGYTTLFATDDRRFNHITEILGFDKVIAPPTGFNDFILGAFNDFPLSNLVVNTRLGEWLFPYNYSNRSAEITYNPKTFVSFFNRNLEGYQNRPLFLGIHVTLPHWPFNWADSQNPGTQNDLLRAQRFYTYAVARVDQQFASIINLLKQQGLLNNALVFIMSDHGQSVGFPEERYTGINEYMPKNKKLSPKENKYFTGNTFGHGTDVLNYSQYHIVLAVREFNNKNHQHDKIAIQTASLLDIKPTILNYLQLPSEKIPGISLLPWLNKVDSKTRVRNLFMETGFTLPGILVANPSIKKSLREGLSYYRIDPKTGAVVIRESLLPLIIKGKQRAVLQGSWIFSCYPLNSKNWSYVLANVKTHEWTLDLNSKLAKRANVESLENKLKAFYGNEILCK